MSAIRDLFEGPHPCLRTVYAILQAEPGAEQMMMQSRRRSGFCRSGAASAFSLTGFGVSGRGATRQEARCAWLDGARAVLQRSGGE